MLTPQSIETLKQHGSDAIQFSEGIAKTLMRLQVHKLQLLEEQLPDYILRDVRLVEDALMKFGHERLADLLAEDVPDEYRIEVLTILRLVQFRDEIRQVFD